MLELDHTRKQNTTLPWLSMVFTRLHLRCKCTLLPQIASTEQCQMTGIRCGWLHKVWHNVHLESNLGNSGAKATMS